MRILLGHGAGGRLTDELVREVFMPHIGSEILELGDDSGRFDGLAVSIDGFTVTPQDFPGGDIGLLAVTGTVNDLAMVGARPLVLSAGFILEEGLESDDLSRWARSMGKTASEVGVEIVACDTKVVEKGSADRIFVTTTGVGKVPEGMVVAGDRAVAGDRVLVSGPVADHGTAIMTVREELGFEEPLLSDVAPLWEPVSRLLEEVEVHVLRDPTRGGLAQTLNEIALSSGVEIAMEERSVPVRPAVRSACDIMGLDPLEVASEGRFVAILPSDQVPTALDVLSRMELTREAAVIGEVCEGRPRVLCTTVLGSHRVVDMPLGEALPRIC
ncbi:hydrogenase expression/formation protein HypE [Candidatus Fermentibacteria bacterium]|nr:hydrogenase expression/formation protein HypE [Candidatus Fermentibacteria bacterium]